MQQGNEDLGREVRGGGRRLIGHRHKASGEGQGREQSSSQAAGISQMVANAKAMAGRR